jgi:biotin carboxylase
VNLLVTNTRHTQAYTIIRALRPHARKIVATVYGENRLAARLSPAANSRHVDRRYYVPSPAADWRAGRIGPENSEQEEAYIQAVLKICEREQIDTIFPSWDPKVYVFAKNRERFEQRGILIPVPDYEAVATPLDKYKMILAAERSGFPCPRTFLPEVDAELSEIARELGFPLVIKLRFTSGGKGLRVVRDLAALRQQWRLAVEDGTPPLVQEFIPGRNKQLFFLVLDRAGDLKLGFCPRTRRLFLRIFRDSSGASESGPPHPSLPRAARMAREVGWWGGLNVQTKIDPRDGQPKLLEVNPRLGHITWYMTTLGINVPLICLKIARGESVEPVQEYPIGTQLLSPVEDCQTLLFSAVDWLCFQVRQRSFGKRPLDTLNPPPPLRELVGSYLEPYLGGKAMAFDPFFHYFRDDPLPASLWWLVFLGQVLRATKHLGQ